MSRKWKGKKAAYTGEVEPFFCYHARMAPEGWPKAPWRENPPSEETLEAFVYPSPLDYSSVWGGAAPDRFALCDRGVTAGDASDHYLGEDEPCIVAFVDFSRWGGHSIYIHYIYVRGDLRGEGYATALIEAFYDHFLDEVGEDGSMDWGRMMDDGVVAIYERMRDAHPDVYHRGKYF